MDGGHAPSSLSSAAVTAPRTSGGRAPWQTPCWCARARTAGQTPPCGAYSACRGRGGFKLRGGGFKLRGGGFKIQGQGGQATVREWTNDI
eukprot:6167778-Pyramimonas_sp.AAC.1